MIRIAIKEVSASILMGPAATLSCSLVEALSLAGQFDEAIAEADALLANISNLARFFRGDVYFLRGEAVLGRAASASADAEACFREAIEIAKSQSARWWELRATTSLARLLAKQGRRNEARTMLADVY